MDSIQPASDCEDVEHGQEVFLQLFVACGQPPHILHPAEEPLDQVAHGIEFWVMRDRRLRVGLRRDDRDSTFIGDGLSDCGAAVGLVGDDGRGRRLPVQKRAKGPTVMGLSAGHVDPQRTP